MNLILGTVIMTLILFCLSIIFKSHQKTLLYYIIIALMTLCVATIFSYKGDIDSFFIDYFLPLINPIIIFEIVIFYKNKKLADQTKNHKIMLFQFQKILSFIFSITIFHVILVLIILKFIFSFPINIILLLTLGLAVIFLIGLTIALNRYKVEKIIVINKNKIYQYQIPPKTYIINRSELFDAETRLNATIYWNHFEVHYVYLLESFDPSEFFQEEPSGYQKVIPLIENNHYTIINVSVINNKINKITIKHRKHLK